MARRIAEAAAAPAAPDDDAALAEFRRLLRESNLVAADEWERQLSGTTTPVEAAAKLTQLGLLTSWQARALLAGRSAFFLGRYELLRPLGAGGMGAVFLARQQPLGRIVALKVMSKDLVGNASAAERFRREIRVAAALDHPNVVRTFDADCVEDTHFLVMEFVEGDDLGAILKRRGRLPAGEACELIRQAALGLQHAHEHGLVHRDLKPENLLVQTSAVGGQRSEVGDQSPIRNSQTAIVKILDFGLAKLESERTGSMIVTATGQMMGTTDYVSPEQAQEARNADVRSDIYSLGCTLFRLISGRVPFAGGTVTERLMARLHGEAPRLRTVCPAVPVELDNVVARMTAREPARRYQTPAEVANALRPFAVAPMTLASDEFAAGLPMIAPADADPTILELSHFTPMILESVVTSESEVAGLLKNLSTQARVREERSPDDTAQADSTGGKFPAVEAGSPLAKRIRARKRIERRRLVGIVAALAAVFGVAGGFGIWRQTGRTTILLDWPDDERGGATLRVDGRTVHPRATNRLVLRGGPGLRTMKITRPGYEPFEWSGEFARGESQTVRPVWTATAQTARRREWQALNAGVEATLSRLAGRGPQYDDEIARLTAQVREFMQRHADTREAKDARLALARLPVPADGLTGDNLPPTDPPLKTDVPLVAVLGGEDVRLTHWGTVRSLCFSPDGSKLASAGEDGLIKIWDAKTGKLSRSWIGQGLALCVAFSPDGRQVASGFHYHVVQLQKIIEEKPAGKVLRGHSASVYDVAFSPDGRTLASAGWDRIIRLWDAATGNLSKELKGHTVQVNRIAFSPDGQRLVSGSDDRTVRLWDVTAGKEIKVVCNLAGPVDSVAFLSNRRVIVAESPGKPVVYDLDAGTHNVLPFRRSQFFRLNHDRKRLAFAAKAHIWIHDLTGDNKPQARPLEIKALSDVSALAFSRDGRFLAGGMADGRIQIWDSRTQKRITPQNERLGAVTALAVSANGRLAATGAQGMVRLWDLARGKVVREFPDHRDERGHVVTDVAFSPDGAMLASAGHDKSVVLRETSTGRLIRRFQPDPNTPAGNLAFDAQGTLLATSVRRVVRVWDLSSGKMRHEFPHGTTIYALAISPDGSLLASAGRSARGGENDFVKLWNLKTGHEVQPGKRQHYSLALAFSPDGKQIFGTIPQLTAWSVKTGEQTARYAPHTLSTIAVRPDGRQIAALSSLGEITLLDVNGGEIRRRFHLGPASTGPSTVAFTPEGRHLITANRNGTVYVLRLEAWPPPRAASRRRF